MTVGEEGWQLRKVTILRREKKKGETPGKQCRVSNNMRPQAF